MPDQERTIVTTLAEMDHGHGINHLACVYLAPVEPLLLTRDFNSLVYVMGRLRGPNGCPWDREQTHDFIKHHLIEEAYEAVDAMDSGDPELLAEELGDLLLQVVFHSQLALSAEEFTLSDVVGHIVSKLIRRHPHVFGDVQVTGAANVLRNWEIIKAGERVDKAKAGRKFEAAQAAEQGLEGTGLLLSVPRAMPALERAQQLQVRSARVGFDWNEIKGVFEKVREEVDELEAEDDIDKRREELGDVLIHPGLPLRVDGYQRRRSHAPGQRQVPGPLHCHGKGHLRRRQEAARNDGRGNGPLLEQDKGAGVKPEPMRKYVASRPPPVQTGMRMGPAQARLPQARAEAQINPRAGSSQSSCWSRLRCCLPCLAIKCGWIRRLRPSCTAPMTPISPRTTSRWCSAPASTRQAALRAILYDRVATAADIYKAGKVQKLLMTGDNSADSYNEVEAMRRTATQLGVPDKDIVLDYAGFSSWDSCYRAREVFSLQSATLVTQKFHLPRALFTCNQLNVKSVGVIADRQPYPTQYNELREYPALAATAWRLLINDQPRFLGPKVDIDTGSRSNT